MGKRSSDQSNTSDIHPLNLISFKLYFLKLWANVEAFHEMARKSSQKRFNPFLS